MSNLQPVKRVNKLGIVSTKHVRVDPKASAPRASMPAPQIKAPSTTSSGRAYKAGNKKQHERTPRAYTASLEDRDPDLMTALDIDHDLGIYRFISSDSEMYEMMTFTSTGNALALIQGGVKNPTDALDYLRRNGMEHLIQRDETPLEAQERRIPVGTYLSEMRHASNADREDPLFMDAMEVKGMPSLSFFESLPNDVRSGRIRLSDIKAVGAARIKKSIGWRVTEEALKKIADGSAAYDADDLKYVLEKFGDASDTNMENALELTSRYGSEFIRDLRDPSIHVMAIHDEAVEAGTDPERVKSLVKYFDEFLIRKGYFTNEFTDEEITRFHDSDVSAQDAAEGRVTLLQLDAIQHHGIAASVSEGWL